MSSDKTTSSAATSRAARFSVSVRLGTGALCLALAFFVHLAVLERPILAEGLPQLGGFFLLETLLVFAGSWLIISSIASLSSPAVRSTDRGLFGTDSPWALLKITWGSTLERSWTVTLRELLLGFVLLLSLFFSLLLAYEPAYYAWLSNEDGLIEDGSALLCGLASFLFLLTAARLFKNQSRAPGWPIAGALLLSLAAFLIAMEEISWFQRYTGMSTPEGFTGNSQSELNLHNFVTSETENAYYFSVFGLLTLLPFVKTYWPQLSRFRLLAFFAPSLFLTYLSAISAAYTFDMWNVPLIQLIFFATALMLLYDLPRARRSGEARYTWAVVSMLVLTQALHLLLGGGQAEIWDVTEYREFFLPLALSAYAAELYLRAGALKARRAAAVSPEKSSSLA